MMGKAETKIQEVSIIELRMCENGLLYVTGFVKRGLPHTSNIPTLTIHNFRLVNATDLKVGQQEAPT